MAAFPNSPPDSLTPNHWRTADLYVLLGNVTLNVELGTEIVPEASTLLVSTTAVVEAGVLAGEVKYDVAETSVS